MKYNLNKIRENIKNHLTLKLYLLYMAFSSIVFLVIGQIVAGLFLAVFVFLGLIIFERNKIHLHLN